MIGFLKGRLCGRSGRSRRERSSLDAKDEMPVRNLLEDIRAEPLAELHDALLMSRWTEMTVLTGKGQEVFTAEWTSTAVRLPIHRDMITLFILQIVGALQDQAGRNCRYLNSIGFECSIITLTICCVMALLDVADICAYLHFRFCRRSSSSFLAISCRHLCLSALPFLPSQNYSKFELKQALRESH